MRIILLLISVWILSPVLYAESPSEHYQIDLILFQQAGIGDDTNESPLVPPIPPSKTGNIPLRSQTECSSRDYCLLPFKASALQQSWYALSRNNDYRLLSRYSWMQPDNNQRAVLLPERVEDDVKIEGTVQVRKGNYYYFNSEISLYSFNNSVPVVLKQHVRLKEDQTVYLDHPHVGILLRIHKPTA